jgi:type II secretory pathway pseudopilin PulG
MRPKHYITLILALALTAATPTQGQSHHDSAEEWQRHHAQQLEQQRQRLQLDQQRRDLQRLQDAQSRAKKEAENNAYYYSRHPQPVRPVLPDRFTVPSERHAPGVRDYYTPSASRPAYGGYYFRP